MKSKSKKKSIIQKLYTFVKALPHSQKQERSKNEKLRVRGEDTAPTKARFDKEYFMKAGKK